MDCGPITRRELDEAIAASKRGRVPGLDGIPAEAWQKLDSGREALLSFMNLCWDAGAFPEEWKKALVVGIFKKGDATKPSNYRPISLLQTAYKLFGRVLACRLQEGLGDELWPTQYGFR